MIGIVCAMDSEFDAIRKGLGDPEEFARDGFRMAEKTSCHVVLARSQIGKTSAAACVEVMTSWYSHIDLMISTGVSGALRPEISIGSAIIGREVIEYGDGAGVRYPLHTIDRLEAGIQAICRQREIPVLTGTILSSDEPVYDASLKERLCREHGAVCVEMESAGVCRECWRRGIRAAVLKTVSDFAEPSPNGRIMRGLLLALNTLSNLYTILLKESEE